MQDDNDQILISDLYSMLACGLVLLVIFMPDISFNPRVLLEFWSSLMGFSPLSELMQGAGVAVLTLLISFAIGIFIHHLGDGERKGNFLDLHVALDYVWMFKRSLAYLSVAVISPFLMGSANLGFKTFVFLVWAVSLYFLFWTLLRLYSWVKGDKDDFRRGYLSDFKKSPEDTVVSWGDFWGVDRNSEKRFREAEFFAAFSREIDVFLRSEDENDWRTMQKMLDGFSSNMGKRNRVFLVVFPEFFPKVLEWHFVIWKKQYSDFAKDKVTKEDVTWQQHLFEVDQVIDQIIRYVTREALAVGSGNAFSYFKSLEVHMAKYQSETIEGQKHSYVYIEQIPIYEDCMNLIPKSKESHDIWGHYFPESWKVTIRNLKDNIVSRVWFNRFMEWSRSRIWNRGKEWDRDLDEISMELFPEVDPVTWARIYTFVFGSWTESRIREAVEKDANYGHVGRIVSGWGGVEGEYYSKVNDEQLRNTLDLAVYLFGSVFTRENLDEWLVELASLDYPEGSDNFRRKKMWEGIFKSLRDLIVKRESERIV